MRGKIPQVECLDNVSHCYSQYTMPTLFAQGLVISNYYISNQHIQTGCNYISGANVY